MEKKVKRAVIKYYIATVKHRTATFYNWVNEFKHGRTFIEMNVVWSYQWLTLQEKQMCLCGQHFTTNEEVTVKTDAYLENLAKFYYLDGVATVKQF